MDRDEDSCKEPNISTKVSAPEIITLLSVWVTLVSESGTDQRNDKWNTAESNDSCFSRNGSADMKL